MNIFPWWLSRAMSYASAFLLGGYTSGQFRFHEEVPILDWALAIVFGVMFLAMSKKGDK